MSYEYACKLEVQLKSEVVDLFNKANSADKVDIPDGMNVPEEIQRREQCLPGITAAKAEIERRAVERQTREQAAYEEKIAARANKELNLLTEKNRPVNSIYRSNQIGQNL